MTIPLGNSKRSLLFFKYKVFYSTAWSRSAFANRIVSKCFKRGKEEYAFSVDKKSKTIALQYLGQKSSKLASKPLVRKLVSQNFSTIFGFSSIFDQLLLFYHKQICIWPLELSEHYDPGNHSKNQQKKPIAKQPECNSHEVWCARFLDTF